MKDNLYYNQDTREMSELFCFDDGFRQIGESGKIVESGNLFFIGIVNINLFEFFSQIFDD